MNDHPPSTLLAKCWADRIRLIAIETMKGAFENEGALRFSKACSVMAFIKSTRKLSSFIRCETRYMSVLILRP
jgi:hypothetical protein